MNMIVCPNKQNLFYLFLVRFSLVSLIHQSVQTSFSSYVMLMIKHKLTTFSRLGFLCI
ncbi:hypothetical protein HanIR_Chr08g0348931 [Helianthus annuus]|nr:hypothetical protein HanIR_Chr08g0348931 [Helianthus annuus]